MKIPVNEAFLSVPEVAQLMHVSRVAVFKKIKAGQLRAEKVGRNYVISRKDLESALGTSVSPKQKKEISNIVKKAVKQYGPAFRRLGKEE